MDDTREKLAALLREEAELQFGRFTYEDALNLGLRFVEVARAEALPIAIDISRSGQQMFHCAMPGSSPDNDAWIQRKVRVVMRYHRSSFYIGQLCLSQGVSFEDKSRLDRDLYAAAGGGFPLIIRDVGVVGCVAVSGLPQAQDHALLVRVLREFLAPAG